MNISITIVTFSCRYHILMFVYIFFIKYVML